jgi:hypothetical protein
MSGTGDAELRAKQPAPAAHAPIRFVAPKASLIRRLNWRAALLAGIAFFFIGGFFYVWARDALSGGIINHGDYSEVNLKAMSSFELDQVNGQVTDIPAKFRGLEGRRVALVGEMWAPREAGDGSLGYFQLVYSRTKCCFNGPPLAQHFVDANVKRGVDAEYSDGMVRVWGQLHIRFRREKGGVIKSVYAVDVDRVDPL